MGSQANGEILTLVLCVSVGRVLFATLFPTMPGDLVPWREVISAPLALAHDPLGDRNPVAAIVLIAHHVRIGPTAAVVAEHLMLPLRYKEPMADLASTRR
jgi:hypothetical protein